MKQSLLVIFFTLMGLFGYSQSNLIISQYTETSSGSTPKGIELWNVSGADIDFSVTALDIEVGFNGSAPSNVFNLTSGTLNTDEVLVVGTSDMSGTVGPSGTCGFFELEGFNFNGDDALVVKLNNVTEDVFGTPGTDPGTSWSGSGVSTANQNIKLKSGITTGDTDGWTDPSERFEMVGAGNTLTDFGTPPIGCTGPSCGIFALTISSVTCNSVTVGDSDTYNVTISYSGSDTAAFVEYTGGGTLNNGGTAGELDGTDILIAGIPETEDWSITVTGGACSLDLNGFAPACDPAPAVVISELDSDQTTDNSEFVELSGPPNTSLNDFVLVLFNGNGDVSYRAVDLDGETLDANGFYVIGSAMVTNVDTVVFTTNGLQNGADGVGLFFGRNDTDFPNGTSVNTFAGDLVDGAVYGTDDGDDAGLLAVLDTVQTNENENGNKDTESIQRNPGVTPEWCVATPTPGEANVCAIVPIELIYFRVAKSDDGLARLTWATAQELNNAYFALEHSIDGIYFKEFDTVNGQGQSSYTKDYEYFHSGLVSGRNYYRLKQVDLDGSFEYSPIRVLDLVEENKMRIYPTLVRNQVTVQLGRLSKGEIVVYSAHGTVLSRFKMDNVDHYFVDFSSMHSGLYIIEVATQSQKVYEKVFKQ